MIAASDVAERLAVVRRRLTQAGGPHVDVLAVTKGFGFDAVQAAHAAGCTAVGESYAQELLAKFDDDQRDVAVHFIGRLQSNKVRQLAGVVDVFASVDRSSLIAEIARRAPGAHILIQVNTTDEGSKGGCPPGETAALVDAARHAELCVDGLMTVGPTQGTAEDARPGFRVVRTLTNELGLGVCSMGMSADLEVAVQEGSTQVRVGTALFGQRNRSIADDVSST